jgi:hypothetical protein
MRAGRPRSDLTWERGRLGRLGSAGGTPALPEVATPGLNAYRPPPSPGLAGGRTGATTREG